MAKSTTTTSYFDPESTSGKTADFAHWQAEFTRAFADFSKLWSNPKASNLDVNWLLTYQRKNFEEAEANAIGTEYVRADFLPVDDAAKVRDLLIRYLDERVLFYTTRDDSQLAKIDAETAQLQSELWIAVRPAAEAHPTPVVALVVSGMNDVLNSQGYTQAAWWNRIPVAAWGMMAVIAVSCNLLIGYGAHGRDWRTLLIVPIVVSIAFFLISDIDSPRGGAIRVAPHNLISLSKLLRSQ